MTWKSPGRDHDRRRLDGIFQVFSRRPHGDWLQVPMCPDRSTQINRAAMVVSDSFVVSDIVTITPGGSPRTPGRDPARPSRAARRRPVRPGRVTPSNF
jgi:hypothetical protein